MKIILLPLFIFLILTNSAIASILKFDGVWEIYEQNGEPLSRPGDDPASGLIDFNPILGTGDGGQIDGELLWKGLSWSTTDFSIMRLTENTYEVTYFWSGFGSGNIVNVWQIDQISPNFFTVITLDGDSNGILGNTIDNGGFPDSVWDLMVC